MAHGSTLMAHASRLEAKTNIALGSLEAWAMSHEPLTINNLLINYFQLMNGKFSTRLSFRICSHFAKLASCRMFGLKFSNWQITKIVNFYFS